MSLIGFIKKMARKPTQKEYAMKQQEYASRTETLRQRRLLEEERTRLRKSQVASFGAGGQSMFGTIISPTPSAQRHGVAYGPAYGGVPSQPTYHRRKRKASRQKTIKVDGKTYVLKR